MVTPVDFMTRQIGLKWRCLVVSVVEVKGHMGYRETEFSDRRVYSLPDIS